MMLYKVMMVLFIFGAVIQGFNVSGLGIYKLPETSEANYDNATIMEYVDSQTDKPAMGSFTILESIWSFMSVIAAGLTAVFALAIILINFGVPAWMAIMIQTPIWLIEAVGIYQIITGNRVEQ